MLADHSTAKQSQKEVDKPTTLPTGKSLLLLSFAGLQNVLGGALIYGWAGIAGSLLLAPTTEGGGGLSSSSINPIFALASCVNYVSTLLLGFILDLFGPRACSVWSNFTVCVGCLSFGMAQHPQHFLIGAMLIAFGGPGVQNSVLHVSNLFPNHQCLAMSCITGTMSLSLSVFPLFGVVWRDYGIDLRSLFVGYSAVLFCSTALSWFIWPDETFDLPCLVLQEHDRGVEPIMKNEGDEENEIDDMDQGDILITQPLQRKPSALSTEHGYQPLPNNLESDELERISTTVGSLVKQLRSATYRRDFFIFLVTTFWANLYVGSIATELGDAKHLSSFEQQQLEGTFIFITSLVGFCAAPLVGMVLDKIGFTLTATIMFLFGSGQMLLLLYPKYSEVAMLASFVFYSLFRVCIFRYLFAAIIVKMGVKFLGILSGVAFAASGILFLIEPLVIDFVKGTCHIIDEFDTTYSYTKDCDRGRWNALHIIQLLTLLCLSFHTLMSEYCPCGGRTSILSQHESLSIQLRPL